MFKIEKIKLNGIGYFDKEKEIVFKENFSEVKGFLGKTSIRKGMEWVLCGIQSPYLFNLNTPKEKSYIELSYLLGNVEKRLKKTPFNSPSVPDIFTLFEKLHQDLFFVNEEQEIKLLDKNIILEYLKDKKRKEVNNLKQNFEKEYKIQFETDIQKIIEEEKQFFKEKIKKIKDDIQYLENLKKNKQNTEKEIEILEEEIEILKEEANEEVLTKNLEEINRLTQLANEAFNYEYYVKRIEIKTENFKLIEDFLALIRKLKCKLEQYNPDFYSLLKNSDIVDKLKELKKYTEEKNEKAMDSFFENLNKHPKGDFISEIIEKYQKDVFQLIPLLEQNVEEICNNQVLEDMTKVLKIKEDDCIKTILALADKENLNFVKFIDLYNEIIKRFEKRKEEMKTKAAAKLGEIFDIPQDIPWEDFKIIVYGKISDLYLKTSYLKEKLEEYKEKTNKLKEIKKDLNKIIEKIRDIQEKYSENPEKFLELTEKEYEEKINKLKKLKKEKEGIGKQIKLIEDKYYLVIKEINETDVIKTINSLTNKNYFVDNGLWIDNLPLQIATADLKILFKATEIGIYNKILQKLNEGLFFVIDNITFKDLRKTKEILKKITEEKQMQIIFFKKGLR